jgi:hypothetical protein
MFNGASKFSRKCFIFLCKVEQECFYVQGQGLGMLLRMYL